MSTTSPPASQPIVTSTRVVFTLPDTDAIYEAVSLFQEVAWPRQGPDFDPPTDGTPAWRLYFPRPEVDRFEYLLVLLYRDGRSEWVVDPGNDRVAPGPFGDKSVIEFPEYRTPAWLDGAEVDEGTTVELELDMPAVDSHCSATLWSAAGADPEEPLPLLVAHDGIEYARYSQLITFLDRMRAARRLPRMRAALLHPASRDEHYSASPEYARSMAFDILPQLAEHAPAPPGRRYRAAMGSSLGALSLLHIHKDQPQTFGGLFLQSGSFFHHRTDRYEIGFEHFQRIRNFMDRVVAEREWDLPIPIAMTCGGVEMNFANNRATSVALRKQGYDVAFSRLRDAHNWVAWRDAFDPHLVGLLTGLWGSGE